MTERTNEESKFPLPSETNTDDLNLQKLKTHYKSPTHHQLTYLDLSNKNFQTLSETLQQKLTSLKTLKLSDTNLKESPDCLSENFANLTSLDLKGNSLKSLPASIGKLKDLESLDLSYNSLLCSLPEEIKYLSNLRFMDLTECPNLMISGLPKGVLELPKLQIVYMGDVADQIVDGLWLGSIYVAKIKSNLDEIGISHILNLTDRPPFFPESFVYCNLPIPDSQDAEIELIFLPATNFIRDAISNGGRVLVHCEAGVSRSASIVLAYLILHCEKSFVEAFCFLRNKRPCVFPNSGFIEKLKKLTVGTKDSKS